VLDFLPLLDGWTYKRYQFPGAGTIVSQGQTVPVLNKEHALGWILEIGFASSDNQMEFWVETENLSYYGTPYQIYMAGGLLPGPYTADVSVYNQPNPLSTYGTYIGDLLLTAYPFPVPHNTKVKCYCTLGPLSTESSALAQYVVDVLEVTDEDALIRSFRKLTLPPATLTSALKDLKISAADLKKAMTHAVGARADIVEALKDV
jgi:hypothetical protein